MKTAVVYKSVSGFTKKYAQLISEELNCDIFDLKDFSFKISKNYDAVIFGGPLHAVGLSGLKSFKSMVLKNSSIKIIVFACGASPADEKVLAEIINKNFSESEKNRIAFHYLRGGFDYNKLNFTNKIIMSLFKRMLEKKKERSEEEQGMLDSYDNPVDFISRENIQPVLDELLI